ncbi:MAG: hypothetical protein ACNA7W_13270 [Pseudomonadales bacterium]
MRALWLTPLGLTLLVLAWYWVQRSWLWCMQRPLSEDALARPGCADCVCTPDADGDARCQRPANAAPVDPQLTGGQS